MDKEKITVFEKVKRCVNKDNIVFEKTIDGKGTYIITDSMQKAICNSFGIWYNDNEICRSLFEKKSYDDYGRTEELVDGPVRYIVFKDENHQKGLIHKIVARGISYTLAANDEDIIVDGGSTFVFANKIDDRVIDTAGFMSYQLIYVNDGLIKGIKADLRVTDKRRGSEIGIIDHGYKHFNFDNIEDFIRFRDNLDNYKYTMSLYEDVMEEVKKIPLEEKNNPRGTSIKGMFIIEGGKSRPFDDSIDLGDDHSKGK